MLMMIQVDLHHHTDDDLSSSMTEVADGDASIWIDLITKKILVLVKM